MRAIFRTLSLFGLGALFACGGGGSSAPSSAGVEVTVSGLFPGHQVVLAVDASQFTITANGDFSFEAAPSNPNGSAAIITQPDNQTCAAAADFGIGPGSSTLFVSVDCLRSGQFVYVVNSGDNTLSMYSQGADGALRPLIPATVATGQVPESIAVDPGSLFAYVANSGDNSISEFDIAANGSLSADSQGLLQQPSRPASRAGGGATP